MPDWLCGVLAVYGIGAVGGLLATAVNSLDMSKSEARKHVAVCLFWPFAFVLQLASVFMPDRKAGK